MYTSPVSLLLGFHGCDRDIGERILRGEIAHLRKSENDYDWLGHGVYFWEYNPRRALEFARELQTSPRRGKALIKNPFVLGAVIDPGKCLNFLESNSLCLLREYHRLLRKTRAKAGTPMPANKKDAGTGELLRRNLDCAVIEFLHEATRGRYDTVRGVFLEGKPLYRTSGFQEKNHIQICVRHKKCIKGYFRVDLNKI